MLFWTLIIVIAFAVAIMADYTAKLDNKPSKHNVLKAIIFALIVIIAKIWITYFHGTQIEDTLLALLFVSIFLFPIVYFIIIAILEHTKKLNKTQKLNFYSFTFVAVLFGCILIYGAFAEKENQTKAEPEKVEVTEPKETKPKETKPESKYGRYEKMEDGSTQFVYYSHKAMVNDFGYDPCHGQGDIDFEAPDSWMYDDYTDRYYRPGDIIWHEDVDSSAILDMGYNFEMEVLYVTFRKNEATYAYYDVPYSVWDDFCCADSYGGYLNKKIKGKFEYERID